MVQYVGNEDVWALYVSKYVLTYIVAVYNPNICITTLSSGKYGTRRQGLECVPVGRRRLPNLFREKALPILPRVSYNSPFHLSFNSESQWFTTLQSKQYNYSVHDTKSRSYKQWDLLWKLYCSLSFLSFHQGNLTNLGQMVDIF